MSDNENEMVRFRMKPNPFFYALEFTRHTLLVAAAVGLFIGVPAICSWKAVVVLLIAYGILGLVRSCCGESVSVVYVQRRTK